LDIEAKVSTYLGNKEWFKRIPNQDSITIRHLMTHTSGIPEHLAEKDVVDRLFADLDKSWKPEDVAPLLFDRKPLFEAGKGWSYADANYIVLGLAIESVLGPESNCYKEIERRFLEPLKLADTKPSVTRVLPGLVQGYSGPGSPFLPEGPVLKEGKLAFSPSFEWAGGGFISSSGDLAKWAWNLWGGKVLKPETLAKMVDGVPAKTGPQDKYGLGAMIEPTSVGVSHGHEGWYPGYLSQTMYLPEHKIAVAVQFNTDDQRGIGHRTRWFCDVVAKAVLGK
jgi:D-alanyl-D-alanine carboxypeptidase